MILVEVWGRWSDTGGGDGEGGVILVEVWGR